MNTGTRKFYQTIYMLKFEIEVVYILRRSIYSHSLYPMSPRFCRNLRLSLFALNKVKTSVETVQFMNTDVLRNFLSGFIGPLRIRAKVGSKCFHINTLNEAMA